MTRRILLSWALGAVYAAVIALTLYAALNAWIAFVRWAAGQCTPVGFC